MRYSSAWFGAALIASLPCLLQAADARVSYLPKSPPPDPRVFIIDASERAKSCWDEIARECEITISKLTPADRFDVFLLRSGSHMALSGKSLLYGMSSHKSAAAELVRKTEPAGAANPLPAMERALAENPAIIFLLLTDCITPPAELAASIGRLNAARPSPARINTFLVGKDASPELAAAMHQIADESGGKYRRIERFERAASAATSPATAPSR